MPLLTTENAAQALRDGGFRVSVAPVVTGSGIDTVLFIDLAPDVRVEVAVFGAQEDADKYAQGLADGDHPAMLIRNALVLFGPRAVSDRNRARIEEALQSA